MGWLNIYAAVFNEQHQSIFDVSQRYGKQLMWIGAAVVLIILIFLVDGRFYTAFAYPIYILTLLLLLVVLLVGREINGARSWIEIGTFRLQPSEFAKLATALALAKFMSVYRFDLMKQKNLLIVAIILFLPAAFILLQNDTGSALVYVSFVLLLYREGLPGVVLALGVFVVLLFVFTLLYSVTFVCSMVVLLAFIYYYFYRRNTKEVFYAAVILFSLYSIFYGLDYYYDLQWSLAIKLILPFLIASLFFIVYIFKNRLNKVYWLLFIVISSLFFTYSVNYVFTNVLESHQRDRINNLLGIEFDPLGAGYNVNQSLIAIGSGGFSGKGYLQGTQTKFNFVPEQSTDFIFCTVGEEWGFVGTFTVLSLFSFLLIRLIIIAERQRSAFSRIYAYGVMSIFFFHLLINVGMTIGLAPVIGIPLPFFSYGGSSLWAFTILLFILLRLDASRNEILY